MPAARRASRPCSSDRWVGSPQFYAMDAAFCAAGWPSYEFAVAERLAPSCPRATKERFEAAHRDWTERLRVAAGVPDQQERSSSSRGYYTATKDARTPKRSPHDTEPLPPAVLRECRELLERQNVTSRSGRPPKWKPPMIAEMPSAAGWE